MQPNNPSKTRINHLVLIGALSILVIGVVLIVALVNIFHKNPYGEGIEISNFKKYYSNVPEDTRDSVYNTLYNIVSSNLPDGSTLPKSGKIRNDSLSSTYDQFSNIYNDTFIVDLEEIQQSYQIRMKWSPRKNNPELSGGYPIIATCVTKEQLIYPEFNCRDGFSQEGIANDPVFSTLPINVAYYNKDYSEYTSYTIKSEVRDNKIIVVINDYTGGNQSAALNTMRENQLNPDNYTIEYHNLSTPDTIPGRAPND